MALLRSLGSFSRRSSLATPEKWLVDWFRGGSETASGVAVNADVAMTVSAIWCAVRIYSSVIASLPLRLYESLDNGGRQPAKTHPVYRLLHRQANRFQTSYEWREMMVGHVVLRGNAYSRILPRGGNIIGELVPLHPDHVTPEILKNGDVVYVHRPTMGPERTYFQDEILHLRGLSSNGLAGMSVVGQFREGIGMMVAAERAGANLHRNSWRPSGALKHPGVLGDQAVKHLRESYEQMHGGAGNVGKPLILEEGMEWQQLGMSAEDAQYIETRKMGVADVARMFNLPPHLLKDLERATFSNIEQQSIELVMYSLQPWIANFEQRFDLDLLLPSEQDRLFTKFTLQGLLRGDYKTRQEGLKIQRENGIISANEWRALEDMNPIEGDEGDMLIVPLNFQPADLARELVESKIKAAAAPKTPPPDADPDPTEPDDRARERQRLWQSASGWRQTQVAYRGILERAFSRLAALGTRAPAEVDRVVQRDIQPILAGYVLSLLGWVSGEVSQPTYTGLKAERDQFVRDYVAGLERRLAAATSSSDSPSRLAHRESVRAACAFAVMIWAKLGVREIAWVASEDACASCRALDRQRVAIGGKFASGELRLQHPGLHDGCNCTVAPVLE